MQSIIITADDFGFSDQINQGIIETVENGVTTEVSLMMNCYGTEAAIEYVNNSDWEEVGIGIHLSLFNITQNEEPFRNADYNQILSEWSSKKLIDRIKDELAKFEDCFQTTPSHITGHKQLQLDPKVIDFVFEYAQKNNIYVRKWGDFETDTVVVEKNQEIQEKFSMYNINTSDYLFGFKYDFSNPPNATKQYEQLIENTVKDAVIEILFHPGYFSDFEKKYTSFLREREADRELLCSKKFKNMLSEHRVSSTKFINKS